MSAAPCGYCCCSCLVVACTSQPLPPPPLISPLSVTLRAAGLFSGRCPDAKIAQELHPEKALGLVLRRWCRAAAALGGSGATNSRRAYHGARTQSPIRRRPCCCCCCSGVERGRQRQGGRWRWWRRRRQRRVVSASEPFHEVWQSAAWVRAFIVCPLLCIGRRFGFVVCHLVFLGVRLFCSPRFAKRLVW